MKKINCPICDSQNTVKLITLGSQPPANDLKMDAASALSAKKYDLSLQMCSDCLYVWLTQLVPPDKLFVDNTYLTGISSETRSDMKHFADSCIDTCHLDEGSTVLDIASNDGTLLTFFKNRNMNVLGLDPSRPACDLANTKGIKTVNGFFSDDSVEIILSSVGHADLITGTNIITHVENPMAFLNNCKKILKPFGSIVLEFYYFESIISNNAFDQIYHEHISYFNFTTFSNMLKRVGLETYKVEIVKSQGGSLRTFVTFQGVKPIDKSVADLLKNEGGHSKILERYRSFPELVEEKRVKIMDILTKERTKGTILAGYGASAKATVMANYLGLTPSILSAIADQSLAKQGKYIPGVGIPVISPEALKDLAPGLIIIFAWNIRNEVMSTIKKLLRRDVRTVVFIPEISFYST